MLILSGSVDRPWPSIAPGRARYGACSYRAFFSCLASGQPCGGWDAYGVALSSCGPAGRDALAHPGLSLRPVDHSAIRRVRQVLQTAPDRTDLIALSPRKHLFIGLPASITHAESAHSRLCADPGRFPAGAVRLCMLEFCAGSFPRFSSGRDSEARQWEQRSPDVPGG